MGGGELEVLKRLIHLTFFLIQQSGKNADHLVEGPEPGTSQLRFSNWFNSSTQISFAFTVRICASMKQPALRY